MEPSQLVGRERKASQGLRVKGQLAGQSSSPLHWRQCVGNLRAQIIACATWLRTNVLQSQPQLLTLPGHFELWNRKAGATPPPNPVLALAEQCCETIDSRT